MARTKTYSVTTTPVAITVESVCWRVLVGENNQVGTADFDIYGASTDTPARYPAGVKKEYLAAPGSFFHPGDILGYVAASTGSMTFSQEEQ